MNYGFVIDNRMCIGCHACTVACKSEHDVSIGVNRTHVKYIEKGEFPNSTREFSVHRCNHCADAPCVEICPTTALYDRADGIVDYISEQIMMQRIYDDFGHDLHIDQAERLANIVYSRLKDRL